MTVAALLNQQKINALDSELLLSHILRKDRAWLLAHNDTALNEAKIELFTALIKRRESHEPLAYILGEKEFYGRAFYVDRRVLIPRPATEALIDEVKLLFENHFEVEAPRVINADTDVVILTWIKKQKTINELPMTIVDVGTGSGCIAITLAEEISGAHFIASDTSSEALKVAKMNVDAHSMGSHITFSNDDIDPLIYSFINPFLLVSNPPYIPEGTTLPPDVSKYEPHEALFAGADGMSVITPLVEAAMTNEQCIGFCMEMRRDQAEKTVSMIEHYFQR